MDLAFAASLFIAGVLTFLAPCTLPLVPAYISWIAGSSGESPSKNTRGRILANALLYVIGFSSVFIVLGTAFGLGGSLLAAHKIILTKIGGVLVMIFGLYLTDLTKHIPLIDNILNGHYRLVPRGLAPGHLGSSFLFGAVFALGWTPCVGPILATALTLAAASATASQGAVMLLVFSCGLALPFLAVAASLDYASSAVKRLAPYLEGAAKIGGILLIVIGYFMATNDLIVWNAFIYRIFSFINYGSLLDYF
jgi:cytochrome c-type biogenesis protein